MNIKTLSFAAIAAVSSAAAFADVPVAKAAMGGNEIRLYASPLSYEVVRNGKTLVPRSAIDVETSAGSLAASACCCTAETKTLSGTLETPVYKKSSVDLSRTETVVDFGAFAVRLAARTDGVAYRFELKDAGEIVNERADLSVPAGARCSFNRTKRKALGNEETIPEFASALDLPQDAEKAFYLPFVFTADGGTVAVTESGVVDYPVLNYGGVEKTPEAAVLKSVFAKYPRETYHAGKGGNDWKGVKTDKGGRWIRVASTEDFIAKAEGPRALPWRVFTLAGTPSALCESDIVIALAEPQAEGADFSWVKPGKVAWDWWNCFDNRLDDPSNGGCNTKTYRRFIDFAAENGVEYVIFDEGWSEALNIWKFHEAVDVKGLIDYANSRGVGIILWMAWAQTYGEEERVAKHFAELGAKGFKVDFMDRADAQIATFLDRFAAACAKYRMVVDYHGAYRPVGLHRKYPNILNYEAIHGLEQMKWYRGDGRDMMRNDVAEFFLRLSAGPMDYTPGAMLNFPLGGAYDGRTAGAFPGSVGTRCRQMAMMALYEAPLQMLCDSPTNYEKNMESFRFMAAVPTVWADVKALGGCPESFAAAARRAKDGSWYAAALAGPDGNSFDLDTSFLGDGEWDVESFSDTEDGAAEPQKYVHSASVAKAGEKIGVRMAPGGGFVAKFVRRR